MVGGACHTCKRIAWRVKDFTFAVEVGLENCQPKDGRKHQPQAAVKDQLAEKAVAAISKATPARPAVPRLPPPLPLLPQPAAAAATITIAVAVALVWTETNHGQVLQQVLVMAFFFGG